MLKRVYGILAFVSLAALLAGGGLAGYLFGAGKLNRGRIDKIASVMRGELDNPASQPAASQPTSQPTTQSARKSARSADELRQQRRDEQLRRAMLERTSRDIAAQKELLGQAVQELVTRDEEFEAKKKSWKEEQSKLRDANHDEGFDQELKYVARLSPKQAKDHLVKTWNNQKADAVRLINALPGSAGQRILDQLKTPDELNILHELLEQVRNSGADAPQPARGPGTATAGLSSK